MTTRRRTAAWITTLLIALVTAVAGPAAPASAAHGQGVLRTGETLLPGQYLIVPGNAQLIMQTDGNLVLYREGVAGWTPNTWGNPGAYMVMQSDGNLVIYRADGSPAWHSETFGTAADRLVLHDNSRLELQDPTGQVFWWQDW